MKPDQEGVSGAIPATSWSLIDRASTGQGGAMAELLQRYSAVMQQHLVRRRGLQYHDAQDVVQGFILNKVIEQKLIAAASRGRGKFRTFLLTALDRYAIDVARHQGAQKRSPAGSVQDIHGVLEVADTQPEGASEFDFNWAHSVLNQVLARMEDECQQDGKEKVWAVFNARILVEHVGGGEPIPYDQLVARFGLASPTQAANLLVTAKRMFERTMRTVIRDYVRDERDVDQEIAELCAILCSRRAE